MVNIKEVAAYVAANNNMSKAAAEIAIKDALAFIADTVANDEVVNLDKFGKFEPLHKAARKGRNPKTGETLDIAATVVPKFIAAKKFKDQVAPQ